MNRRQRGISPIKRQWQGTKKRRRGVKEQCGVVEGRQRGLKVRLDNGKAFKGDKKALKDYDEALKGNGDA